MSMNEASCISSIRLIVNGLSLQKLTGEARKVATESLGVDFDVNNAHT